ncbi:MAG TPA: type II toxin-antitoxin system prevent-host-death family antitoxin [Acidobacteriaceae bacterium]|nr:type II toxin-antitoxin system prevent-host-death family antitoxin [Acidobacteriaceae bacterium]
MKTVPAGKFKAQCLALIDDVYDHGGEVLITKRGQVKAKLVPVEKKERESIFGFMKGRAKIVGNILEPVMTDEDVTRWQREWDELNR